MTDNPPFDTETVYDLTVGDSEIPELAVTPYDSATAATVRVTAPDGTDLQPPVTVSAADGTTQTWTADPVLFTQPGRWVIAWTVTGTGAGVQYKQVNVYLPPLPGSQPWPGRTDDIGMVRLLATDVDPTNMLFSDEQIAAFLALEGGSVRRAAALTLETMSTSEVLIAKKLRTQDLQTDGPAVAGELRARAAMLRQQAADAPVADGGDGSALDVVDFDPQAAYRYPWS